jgi:predicted ArsR family transcriptional regulator
MQESCTAVTKLSRCLASYPRLAIVAELLRTTTTSPSQAADLLKIRGPVATRHLQVLAESGLLSETVAANRHPYQIATHDAQSLPGGTIKILRNQLKGALFDDEPPECAKALFSAATAFTYTRRIEILKTVKGADGVTLWDLASELQIPIHAVRRHLIKLRKRGYLRQDKKSGSYHAQGPSCKIHRELLSAIERHW